jgi:hypothetical protein
MVKWTTKNWLLKKKRKEKEKRTKQNKPHSTIVITYNLPTGGKVKALLAGNRNKTPPNSYY